MVFDNLNKIVMVASSGSYSCTRIKFPRCNPLNGSTLGGLAEGRGIGGTRIIK